MNKQNKFLVCLMFIFCSEIETLFFENLELQNLQVRQKLQRKFKLSTEINQKKRKKKNQQLRTETVKYKPNYLIISTIVRLVKNIQ